MRKLLVGFGVIAGALASVSANATVTVSSSSVNLAPPSGPGVLVDFESAVPAQFTTSGSGYFITSGSSGQGATPLGDSSHYLSVYGGSFSMLGTVGYNSVSLLWGSIDTYNYLDLLNAAGNVIGTVDAAAIQAGNWADGNQTSYVTNRRVTIGSTDAIYGIKLRSNQAAFEADDIKFSGAVPEPATWAMMVMGFGLLGTALRRSRGGTPAITAA